MKIAHWMMLAAVMYGGGALADEESLLGGTRADEDSPLAQCAQVDDATARLDCYDTLAGRPPGGAEPPDMEHFGKPPPEPVEMRARIVGRVTQWRKGTLFKLDNGQLWQSMDDTSAYYPDLAPNPEVVITRNLFGYRMEVIEARRRLAVRRMD